jgi:hypothetical protein
VKVEGDPAREGVSKFLAVEPSESAPDKVDGKDYVI